MATALLAVPRIRLRTDCCWRCRKSIRLHSSDARRENGLSPPAPPAAGVALLGSRRLISVAGPDAAKYLQGVITSNMHPGEGNGSREAGSSAAARHGFYSGFLNAQGRVLHDVFVYRDTLGMRRGKGGGIAAADDPAFLVEVDAEEARTLEKHIRRYKLRARFDVRLLDVGELAVWHAWGEGADAGAAADSGPAAVIPVRDTRAPGLGWRYVGAPGSAAGTVGLSPSALALSLDAVDESAYRVRRYLLGVAEGQREMLRGQALPLESNMDLMGGIDFHKGCYVGQELTIRTRHRGVVRKRILPCVVCLNTADAADSQADGLAYLPDSRDLAGAVPPETSIGRVGKKGRSAGKWLAGVGNVGLALCRLEPMTDIVLPEEAAAAAATSSSAPGEFVMTWAGAEGTGEGEGAVRIKAFVPDWLRQGLVPAS